MQKRKQPAAAQHDWTLVDSKPLHYLTRPEGYAAFLAHAWELEPKLYKAQPDRKKLFPELSSLKALKAILQDESEVLEFGVDLNAARYVDGVRETLNGEVADRDTVVSRYEDEGCTIQWHQPQRWLPSLWRLIAAMERDLGCLVGANAYITPAGTQGLAPHYDDVDLWVCQTEGSKRWRLYPNRKGYELPAASSPDFQQSEIGEPVMDVTLEVGDVLFMPRGTVHQAVADGPPSCHVTISTYQHWALADFALVLLQELQNGIPAASGRPGTPFLPPKLRPGLPIGFLYSAGFQRDLSGKAPAESCSSVAEKAAQGLRELADRLEAEPKLTSLAADALAQDFIASRAPPHPEQLPERGSPPTISSRVRLTGKGFCRLLPCQASPEVQEAYSGETSFVKVLSCLKNDIRHHMIRGGGAGPDEGEILLEGEEDEQEEAAGGTASKLGKNPKQLRDEDSDSDEEEEDDDESAGDLVFPTSYRAALVQLLEAGDPIAVKDIKLRNKEEKVGLAYSLWEERIICTTSEKRSPKKLKA